MRGRRRRVGAQRRSRIPPSTPTAPIAKHRRRDAQFPCDLRQRPTAARQQGYCLPLELIGKLTTSLAHSTPSRSSSELSKGVHQFAGGSRRGPSDRHTPSQCDQPPARLVLSASDTVGPLNNLFTAVCLNRASDSREPLAVAANPLSEDDTQTAENWDACWNALESLPGRDLPPIAMHTEAPRLITSWRAPHRERGL